MTLNEQYLNDIDQAASAVGTIPNDYQQLRALLSSLPPGTAPDVRSGRAGALNAAAGAGGLDAAGLTIQSQTPIGSESGIGLGVSQAPTIGLRNFFEDSQLSSGPDGTAVSLIGGASTIYSRDWRAIFAVGATGIPTCGVLKSFGTDDRSSNPLATGVIRTQIAGWTAAGTATVFHKAFMDAPAFTATVMPYFVFSATVFKDQLTTQQFNNATGVVVRLAIRNAADTVTLAESTPLDFLNLGLGEFRRMSVACASSNFTGAALICRIEITVTTAGATVGGNFSVTFGVPQAELAPTGAPTIYLPEPLSGRTVVFVADGDSAWAVKRFNDGSPPPLGTAGRLSGGITSAGEGYVMFGGSSATGGDVRLRRTAVSVLRLDNGAFVPARAVIESYAGVGPGTPGAGLGRLYLSSVDKHWHQIDDAGVDTDLAAATPTQVSRDAAAAAADYVARIRLTTDTTYRGFLGLTAADEGSLELGGGGVGARDVRAYRRAAGQLGIDALGAAVQTYVQLRSTAGQRSLLGLGVTGDTADRTSLYGDATVAGILLGSGAAGADLRGYRSGAKVWTFDDSSGGAVTVNHIGTLQQGGTNVSLLGHGAADHADVTRNVFIQATHMAGDGATSVGIGATANIIRAQRFADAATQGVVFSFQVPDDWASGVLTLQPVWSPGASDAVAHTVRWSMTCKNVVAGTTVTAAGTTVTFTGASAARTIGVAVFDTATSTGVTPAAAKDLFQVELQRIGADAADTYVGTVDLLGVIVSYTANQ